jgi:hypothetical protein
VAIFEIFNEAARSDRDTVPCRFRVRRICFFDDENPVSRLPTSTSSTTVIGPRRSSDIIYLRVYKIDGRTEGLPPVPEVVCIN